MQETPYPVSCLYRQWLPEGVAIRAGVRPEAGSGCGSVQGVGDFTVPEGPAGHQEGFHANSAVRARGLREKEKQHISRLFMAPRIQGLGIIRGLCDGTVAAIHRLRSGRAL
jgi:hypothetical protein